METFTKEYRGNVVVITVNLVSATLNDTNEFKGFMDELILMTECDVVVDLAACSHLDSTFIGALVLNYKKLKEKSRYMVLVEPNDQTKVFLTMNSLSKTLRLNDLSAIYGRPIIRKGHGHFIIITYSICGDDRISFSVSADLNWIGLAASLHRMAGLAEKR